MCYCASKEGSEGGLIVKMQCVRVRIDWDIVGFHLSAISKPTTATSDVVAFALEVKTIANGHLITSISVMKKTQWHENDIQKLIFEKDCAIKMTLFIKIIS